MSAARTLGSLLAGIAPVARDLELNARDVVEARDAGALAPLASEQQRVAAALKELRDA